MYINGYALEVMARTRLADLRADATRHDLLASLRAPKPSAWATLRSALQRLGHRTSGRKIVSPRSA